MPSDHRLYRWWYFLSPLCYLQSPSLSLSLLLSQFMISFHILLANESNTYVILSKEICDLWINEMRYVCTIHTFSNSVNYNCIFTITLSFSLLPFACSFTHLLHQWWTWTLVSHTYFFHLCLCIILIYSLDGRVMTLPCHTSYCSQRHSISQCSNPIDIYLYICI